MKPYDDGYGCDRFCKPLFVFDRVETQNAQTGIIVDAYHQPNGWCEVCYIDEMALDVLKGKRHTCIGSLVQRLEQPDIAELLLHPHPVIREVVAMWSQRLVYLSESLSSEDPYLSVAQLAADGLSLGSVPLRRQWSQEVLIKHYGSIAERQ